jgi:hypothetical protein
LVDREENKALVPARGEAILYVGNHTLKCQVTGVSARHLVVLSPEPADLGLYIRCLVNLVDLPQWIDGDAILVQQVQDLKGPRSQIWTLEIQSLTPPGDSALEAFVGARRHVGTRTGAQPRITPRTRPGVGAVDGSTRKPDATRKADTGRAGLYHQLCKRVRDAKPRTRKERGKPPRKRTLAEELKDYLEDCTPIEEIYASALEELDRERERQRKRR